MRLDVKMLRKAIENVEKLIESGRVSDEMIAAAWILAFPPLVAKELVTFIDEWVRRAAIAKAEGRNNVIDHTAMPDPLISISYGDQGFGPAMWHYCDDDGVPGIVREQIAEANGYDLKYVDFDNDPALGWDDEQNMPDILRRQMDGELVVNDWEPTPPEGDGWFLIAKHDTEEGPAAVFARKITKAEAPDHG